MTIYKSIGFPEKLNELIQKLAKKNKRSFSNQVVILLEEICSKQSQSDS